jgi:DHA1 family bicyclomycin/chloramphenicol resistance-like MFS transporter
MSYPAWLPLLLGFLTAVGPITTDMYLPSFPAIEASLGVRTGSAQITLATWFAGLALGQLTQGSLSDRFGRRGPLIIATAIYTLANAGCALAPDLWTVAGMRFVAGFGGSASMVVPRAIVRDLADGHAAARLMSKLMLVMGAAPILAPTLGGMVLTFAAWHALFWICTAYGVVCCALVLLVLPDTLPPERRLQVGIAGMLARYISVLRDPVFLAYTAIGAFGYFGMFAYIGGSSPVFIQHFGVSPAQYGMLFGLGAASFIAGSQIGPRLLPRFGAERVISGAGLAYLAAAGLLSALAALDVGGLWAILLAMMLAMASLGFILPNAAVGALSRHAAQAGSASAMMGTVQFGLAGLSGGLVGLLADGTPRPLGLLMLLGAVAVNGIVRLAL